MGVEWGQRVRVTGAEYSERFVRPGDIGILTEGSVERGGMVLFGERELVRHSVSREPRGYHLHFNGKDLEPA